MHLTLPVQGEPHFKGSFTIQQHRYRHYKRLSITTDVLSLYPSTVALGVSIGRWKRALFTVVIPCKATLIEPGQLTLDIQEYGDG